MKSWTKRDRHLHPGMIFQNLSHARFVLDFPSLALTMTVLELFIVAAYTLMNSFQKVTPTKVSSTLEIGSAYFVFSCDAANTL